MVTGFLADEVENVGADIEAAESVQIPIGLHGADLGVVVVEVGVGCTNERVGHGITEHYCEDAIALGVGLGFVEGDEYKGATPEAGVLVIDERLEEVAGPLASDCYGGIVAVVCLYGR